MAISKRHGFSYGEALVSIAILGIISVAAMWNLRTARYKDELRTAQRVLAADLRSAQSRALSAQNVKFCRNAVGQYLVCESSEATCVGACAAAPAAAIGLKMDLNASSYDFFARSVNDGSLSMTEADALLHRDFVKSGAANVVISSLAGDEALSTANVAFLRQNGAIRINVCPTCTEQSSVTITLKHTITNDTKIIRVIPFTGRISVE